MLSGVAIMSVLNDVQSLGLDKVVNIPARIGESFHFGELMVAIETVLKANEPMLHHARIARRAYELYENGGSQDGHDVQHWMRAERELAG